MTKITFLGAGNIVFAKNVLIDFKQSSALHDCHIALYDIDHQRLRDSETMLKIINKNTNKNRVEIISYIDSRESLKDADYVINAIQVGGYKLSIKIWFKVKVLSKII